MAKFALFGAKAAAAECRTGVRFTNRPASGRLDSVALLQTGRKDARLFRADASEWRKEERGSDRLPDRRCFTLGLYPHVHASELPPRFVSGLLPQILYAAVRMRRR
jgi:hypothetical protein